MRTAVKAAIQPDIVRPGEFAQRLGITPGRFSELAAMGRFRHLEAYAVSQALGARVYSRKKVDRWFEENAAAAIKRKVG